MTAKAMIPPGSTIGILGGGQLGRMLALAAAPLGYRVHIYAPDEVPPAADTSATATRAAWDDGNALEAFARAVDVVTYEFENVPVATVRTLAAHVPVRPGARALEVAQDRLAEKQFVSGIDGVTAPFAAVDSLDDLRNAIARLGTPCILKTRRMGYDGKGQVRITQAGEAPAAWEALNGQPAVLEGFVTFDAEFSILLARGPDGSEAHYPPVENHHVGGILSESRVPAAPLIDRHAKVATELAVRIADGLDYVGLLACEFFATDNGPVFNEMAPRVHNSGHWTIEGAATSQFEQHIRAVCGLPLGATGLRAPQVTMRNLLGSDVDAWAEILQDRTAHLHLYGKADAAPGRKMGHVTYI